MHRNDSVESQIRLYTDMFDKPAEIAIDQIDTKQSHQNQNRGSTKVDDENVLRIASSAELGVILPPIIVNRVGSRYQIIDGIHRTEAAKLRDKSTIWAYVVEVDADIYAQMCLGANASNGKPLTDKERIANALAQIRLGLPATTAGKVWGIEADRLGRIRRASSGKEKIVEAGLNANKVREGAAEAINRLETDQIKALGKTVETATIKEIEDAVQAILSAPAAHRATEATKQAIVLETQRTARIQPKARTRQALSGAQLRHRAREILHAVRANRNHSNDTELVSLIAQIEKALTDARQSAA